MQYVYMHEPYVMKTEYCYTLACFAGWWGYLKYQNEGEFNERGYFQTDNGPFADEMAKQMGARRHGHLARFMQEHPEIWGNPNGAAMFTRPEAYGRRYNLTLGDIIEHWDGVIERMPDDGSN